MEIFKLLSIDKGLIFKNPCSFLIVLTTSSINYAKIILKPLNTKKTTAYGMVNPGQDTICGGLKFVNGV